jgi:hypothetical protein
MLGILGRTSQLGIWVPAFAGTSGRCKELQNREAGAT